jgi:hypothetical integral membrane protein (TIGR02206 family)
MIHRFALFGTSHLFAMALSVGPPAVAAHLVRSPARRWLARFVCNALAAILLINWILWLAYLHSIGGLNIGNSLLMNPCDWATIATLITLVRPNQYTYELAYFWALGGTLQGMLTPDLAYDFPDVQFIYFFIYHGGIIAAVIFVTVALGLRPVPRSILRVVAWTLAYAASAGLVDWLLRTNYGMLRAKPGFPTVLDFLAPWPWYIPELVALGFLSALVYYAPWFLADTAKRPASETA